MAGDSPQPHCLQGTAGPVPGEGMAWGPRQWGHQPPLTPGSHRRPGLAWPCWQGQGRQSAGDPGRGSAAAAAVGGRSAHPSWRWRRQRAAACVPRSSLPGRRRWPGTGGGQWGTRACWSQGGSGGCWARWGQGTWGAAVGTGGLGAGPVGQAPPGSSGGSVQTPVTPAARREPSRRGARSAQSLRREERQQRPLTPTSARHPLPRQLRVPCRQGTGRGMAAAAGSPRGTEMSGHTRAGTCGGARQHRPQLTGWSCRRPRGADEAVLRQRAAQRWQDGGRHREGGTGAARVCGTGVRANAQPRWDAPHGTPRAQLGLSRTLHRAGGGQKGPAEGQIRTTE